MGKGARNRKQREVVTTVAKNIVSAEIKKDKVQRAMHNEINNQLALAHDRFLKDETSVILYVLHEVFGFGPVRLKRFYDQYSAECDKLRDWYEASDSDMPWLTKTKLAEAGIDLDAWEKEDNERGQ